jgi:hypothetical protein
LVRLWAYLKALFVEKNTNTVFSIIKALGFTFFNPLQKKFLKSAWSPLTVFVNHRTYIRKKAHVK